MSSLTHSSDLPKQTLLVVDDNPLNILVLYKAFSPEYRVLKASSGAEAIQICQTRRPDLVLLDLVIPEMDGFEVCRRLKADLHTRYIPIIFVTGEDDQDQETLGLKLGAVDFIVKPINEAVVRARVKTHLSLAHSSSMLDATLEASSDGILILGSDGNIRSMNQAFLRMWELPRSLVDVTSIDAVFAFMDCRMGPAILFDDQVVPFKQAIKPDDFFECMELDLLGDRYIELEVKPLRINGGRCGQVLVFREVTERKRAARELVLVNESLETRIRERTQELEVASELAQAASRAKSEFLSNMSHEIRTPMNAVIGLTHLALQTELSLKQRDYLEKIQLSGKHLLGIVTEILDFSKIEAGKLALDESDFRVQSVFDNVFNVAVESAELKGLKLVFEADPCLSLTLRGDPLRIGQILLNYVGNAIKFTERGEVRVRAEMQQRADGDPLIRIEVQDSGVGLSEAQIARLFQSFNQVDNSATRRHDGTGLGLALSKQLAGLMGGEVGVSSRVAEGSTFWFTFQARMGEAQFEVPVTHSILPPADPRLHIQGARVLLVEDNRLNQEVMLGLLEGVGVLVTLANNGQQALECLSAHDFDAVLMDVQMPVMDGLQATRLIRENPSMAHLPVLAITANAGIENRTRCQQAGMSDFLVKPVAPEKLFAALVKWLPVKTAVAPLETVHAHSPVEQGGVDEPVFADIPAGDPNVIDLRILARAVDGDIDLVRRYGCLFVDGVRESIVELDAALEKGDVSALADLGHRMKSSARMVGALGLSSLCASLEALRTGGTLGEAAGIVEQIPLMLERISADIGVLTLEEER